MSTRPTIWVVFIGVLVLVLVWFFFMRGGMGPVRQAMEQETGGPPAATAPAAPARGDWLMFHGGQGLLGRAAGTLTDTPMLLWKFKTEAEVKSSPVIQEGRVFVGSSDDCLYALDLATGGKLWSYKTEDAIEGAPCVVDGRVFVGSADNFLYALDAETGVLAWKYETDGQILGSVNWTRAPDGRGTWILVGSYDNRLHCVDSRTGQAVWTYETDNYINGSPAVADGKAVFGGCDAMIHVVSLVDGTRAAQVDTGSYIAASAAFLDGRVYVGNYENVFLCVDVDANSVAWKYSRGDAPFFSSPAVGDRLVVFGGRDEYIHGVQRDNGAPAWTFKTLGEVNSSPALCDGKVVVGSDDGRLYLLRLADGKRLWSYEIGQPVTSSPAVAGGVIVVGSDDGYVYAFGPKQTQGSEAQ